MDTDFERRLSDVLHATAPEPPAAYRFSPAPGTPPAGTAGEFDLIAASQPRRRHRTPLLAAAALVVLAGGVTAGALAGRGGGAPAGDRTSSRVTPAAQRRCVNDDLVLSAPGANRSGSNIVLVVRIANDGRTACRLTALPVLSVHAAGPDSAGAAGEPLAWAGTARPDRSIAAGAALSFTARLTAARSCPESARGQSSIVLSFDDGFLYSFPIPDADCPVTPVGVTATSTR